MASRIEDPGPFRFSEIHGPRRTVRQREHVIEVLRRGGVDHQAASFQLVRIPTLELIESLIVESCARGRSTFDYERWRRNGAPEEQLREVWAEADQERRSETSEHPVRIEELERFYAQGVDVDPLIGVPFRKVVLSSGARAVFLVDGRHRIFGAVAAGVDVLPVYLLIE